jgi:RES domain-containing protein
MRARCGIISTIWRLADLPDIAGGIRFAARAYRAHDPRWSFEPASGKGAAITGGRFNRVGQAALYLSLLPITALAECTQGFANRMMPLTLCEYDIDCEGVADLTDAETRTALGVSEADIGCAWLTYQRKGKIAPSQAVAAALQAKGAVNLVLWKWGDTLPSRVAVYDPDGRLGRSAR